jgi:hypothetical protein
MNTSSFLQNDGTLQRDQGRHGWLPRRGPLQQALQFNFRIHTPDGAGAISMRQGMGLVVVAALLAGLLPFIVNWITATRLGTALPLARLAQAFADSAGDTGTPLANLGLMWQTIAGIPPAFFPGWLAAFLSSLGVWINWPLTWLTWWIVYGTGVLVVAKAWGTPTTLQRFFAVTSYAAVPLILLGLGPIPWLGLLAQWVGVVWMLALYSAAVRAVTGLDWARTVSAVLVPGALASLLVVVTVVALVTSLLRLFAFPF